MTEAQIEPTLTELIDTVLEQNGKTVKKAPKWETDAKDATKAGLRRLAKPALALRERDANEAAVRLLVVDILADVFGYDKYSQLSTEFRDRDLADIVITIGDVPEIMVEIKKAGQRLTERQVSQVAEHAKKAGTKWLILTNGIHWQIHRLGDSPSFLFGFDLESMGKEDYENAALLHHQMVKRGRLTQHWERLSALSVETLRQVLATDRVVTAARLEIKALTGVNPDDIEVREALLSYGGEG